jgi:hypothetical protein
MKCYQASEIILNEKGKPLSAKRIAKLALDREMLESVAFDPVDSIAQTIEKGIRERYPTYNNLKFVRIDHERLICLSRKLSTDSGETINIQIIFENEHYKKIQAIKELFEFSSDLDLYHFLINSGIDKIENDLRNIRN